MRKFCGMLLVALALAGCDSNNNDGCFPNEDFPIAECLAEALLNSCDRLSCSSANSNVSPVPPNCEVVDCSTFECEEVSYRIDDMIIVGPGLFTDLELDDTDTPVGIINVEGEDQEFQCVLVVP